MLLNCVHWNKKYPRGVVQPSPTAIWVLVKSEITRRVSVDYFILQELSISSMQISLFLPVHLLTLRWHSLGLPMILTFLRNFIQYTDWEFHSKNKKKQALTPNYNMSLFRDWILTICKIFPWTAGGQNHQSFKHSVTVSEQNISISGIYSDISLQNESLKYK